ncbi:MAG: Rrf2 family transcriptional regulator [Verrucomicrobia bacterium]|nr:MAG: Rrf2 family transcriptional regulator [Verrucomicrobiota bacterium]
MKLSVKVDYACRVLVQLARRQGTENLAHIEELARVEAVPATYLVQILSELRNGGLINSRRGKQGGYALARPAQEISLFDILSLIEGDVLELGGAAEGQSGKRVAQAWSEVRGVLETACREITLENLAAKSGEEMYYI